MVSGTMISRSFFAFTMIVNSAISTDLSVYVWMTPYTTTYRDKIYRLDLNALTYIEYTVPNNLKEIQVAWTDYLLLYCSSASTIYWFNVTTGLIENTIVLSSPDGFQSNGFFMPNGKIFTGIRSGNNYFILDIDSLTISTLALSASFIYILLPTGDLLGYNDTGFIIYDWSGNQLGLFHIPGVYRTFAGCSLEGGYMFMDDNSITTYSFTDWNFSPSAAAFLVSRISQTP